MYNNLDIISRGQMTQKAIIFYFLLNLCATVPITAATLHGTVIDSESSAGIPSATVQVSLGDDVVAEASTDEHGQFSFDEAKSGYRVTAKKNGYVHAFRPETFSRTVAASDFDDPGVRLTLTPACAISGRVLDSSGQPARGAKVLAMARRAGPGGSASTPWAQARKWMTAACIESSTSRPGVTPLL